MPTVEDTYLYNGRGERVSVTDITSDPTTLALFAYDENGHLLGRYANQGNLRDSTETVWFGDMPIAVLKASTVYYIHTDYLNTPRQIDNATGQAVWVWEPDAFGSNAPNADPLNSGANFGYDLRFPGQIAEKEPGLRYNYYRDYDAALGRYVESDRIGQAAGPNTYLYALANPISGFDVLGLCAQLLQWEWATGARFGSLEWIASGSINRWRRYTR